MREMLYASTNSPCAAQFIKILNAELFKDDTASAYRAIVDCYYVDDYVDSFDTVSDAITVTRSVIDI